MSSELLDVVPETTGRKALKGKAREFFGSLLDRVISVPARLIGHREPDYESVERLISRQKELLGESDDFVRGHTIISLRGKEAPKANGFTAEQAVPDTVVQTSLGDSISAIAVFNEPIAVTATSSIVAEVATAEPLLVEKETVVLGVGVKEFFPYVNVSEQEEKIFVEIQDEVEDILAIAVPDIISDVMELDDAKQMERLATIYQERIEKAYEEYVESVPFLEITEEAIVDEPVAQSAVEENFIDPIILQMRIDAEDYSPAEVTDVVFPESSPVPSEQMTLDAVPALEARAEMPALPKAADVIALPAAQNLDSFIAKEPVTVATAPVAEETFIDLPSALNLDLLAESPIAEEVVIDLPSALNPELIATEEPVAVAEVPMVEETAVDVPSTQSFDSFIAEMPSAMAEVHPIDEAVVDVPAFRSMVAFSFFGKPASKAVSTVAFRFGTV